MVQVPFAPHFNNDFPLNTNGYTERKAHDAVADAIVGAAPGAAVNVTKRQIKHSTNSTARDGGKVEVETVSLINRNTTTQDATNIENEVKAKIAPSFTYARDLSGNGGPAFTRNY